MLVADKGYVVGTRTDSPVIHSLGVDLFEEFLHEDVWLKSGWDRADDDDHDDDPKAPPVNIQLHDIVAEDDQFVFLSPTNRPTSHYGRDTTTLAWSFDRLRSRGNDLYFRISDLAEDYRAAVRDLGYEEVGDGAEMYFLHPDDESGGGVDIHQGDGILEVVLQDMAKVGTLTEPAGVKALARAVAMAPPWVASSSGLSPALKQKVCNTIDKWLREIRSFRDAYRTTQGLPDGDPWSSGIGLIWSLKKTRERLGDRDPKLTMKSILSASSPIMLMAYACGCDHVDNHAAGHAYEQTQCV